MASSPDNPRSYEIEKPDVDDQESTPTEATSSEATSLDERFDNAGLLTAVMSIEPLEATLATYEDIKNAVAEEPPTFLPVLKELGDIVNEDNVRWSTLGQTIEKDEQLTRRLIEVINSRYIPIPTQVKSVSHAASLLTTPRLLDLAMTVGLYNVFDRPPFNRIELLDPVDYVRHSAMAGAIARVIATETEVKGIRPFQAVVASSLHDIGIYVLGTVVPKTYRAILKRQSLLKKSLVATEREVLGCDHADIGSLFLSMLGFSPPIVEAVAVHHLSVDESSHRMLAGLTALSNQLANTRGVSVIRKAAQESMDFSVKDVVRDIKPEWARADVGTAVFVRHGERINVRLTEIDNVLKVIADASDFVQEDVKPVVEEKEPPPKEEEKPLPEMPVVRTVKRKVEPQNEGNILSYLIPGLHAVRTEDKIEGGLVMAIFFGSILGLIADGGAHTGATILLVAAAIGAAVWNFLILMRNPPS